MLLHTYELVKIPVRAELPTYEVTFLPNASSRQKISLGLKVSQGTQNMKPNFCMSIQKVINKIKVPTTNHKE